MQFDAQAAGFDGRIRVDQLAGLFQPILVADHLQFHERPQSGNFVQHHGKGPVLPRQMCLPPHLADFPDGLETQDLEQFIEFCCDRDSEEAIEAIQQVNEYYASSQLQDYLALESFSSFSSIDQDGMMLAQVNAVV